MKLKDFFQFGKDNNEILICPLCEKQENVVEKLINKDLIPGNLLGEYYWTCKASVRATVELTYSLLKDNGKLKIKKNFPVIHIGESTLVFRNTRIYISGHGFLPYDCLNSENDFSIFDENWIKTILTFS